MIGVAFRPGVAADAAAVMRLHRRAILVNGRRAYSAAECESWAAGLAPARYVEAMVEGERYDLATGADGAVLGFCSRKGEEVIGLYVDPAVGGRGIGGALLARAERAIAADGHRAVRIKAALSGLSFYLARGYRIIERTDWTTRGGLVIPVAIVTKPAVPA